MPQPASLSLPRFGRLAVLVLAAVIVAGGLGLAAGGSAMAGSPGRDDITRFMWAMAGQESGWDYYARNRSSGAFGKYQIMPFNWPSWAGKYLGDRRADQTPYNQERVAYGKLRDLFGWLGSWKRVAYWWLTGKTDPEMYWSAYARGYVTNIMRLRRRAPEGGAPMPARTSSRARKGDWRRSGSEQRLRLSVGGRLWPERGQLRDGQVLRVQAAKTTTRGERWLGVVTADGRAGWLRQVRTVPAHAPKSPKRWRDVGDTGEAGARRDRKLARPRPR